MYMKNKYQGVFWSLSSAEILLRLAEITHEREIQLHLKVFKQYKYDVPYSKQMFENFSMQLYF